MPNSIWDKHFNAHVSKDVKNSLTLGGINSSSAAPPSMLLILRSSVFKFSFCQEFFFRAEFLLDYNSDEETVF